MTLLKSDNELNRALKKKETKDFFFLVKVALGFMSSSLQQYARGKKWLVKPWE